MAAIGRNTVHPTLHKQHLPVELWMKVFYEFCFPQGPSDFPTIIHAQNRRSWPLLLSHTCFEWRQIIFTHPELWSSIWMDLSDVLTSSYSALIAEMTLRNSKGRPLTLGLDVTSTETTSTSILPLIREVIPRCVVLDISFKVFQSGVLAGVFPLPLLEDLTLRGFGNVPPSPRESLGAPWNEVFDLISSPNLTSLNVDALGWVFDYSALSNLTSLTCKGHVHKNEVVEIAANCPSLQYLDIRTSSVSFGNRSSPRIVFPSLTSFKMDILAPYPAILLQSLDAPLLTDLELKMYLPRDLPKVANSLAELVSLSTMKVQSLWLTFWYRKSKLRESRLPESTPSLDIFRTCQGVELCDVRIEEVS